MFSKSLSIDPRPDLKADHEVWNRVLAKATQYCTSRPECFQLPGNLHGLRCGGARILRKPNGNLKLVPGEWRSNEWRQKTARYLDPYKEHVKAILLLAQKKTVYSAGGKQEEKLEQVTLFG